MGGIEAIYIFDEHNNLLLSHTYQLRPPPPSSCIQTYLSTPAPRPSCLYAPSLSPPSTLYTLQADSLLLLTPISTDIPPLAVLEFLHRIADCLSDLLGSPLLASRLEANYDIVAQILGEACDAGMIASTEPNAVRETIDTPSAISKFLGLPGSGPPSSVAAGRGMGMGASMPGLGSGGAGQAAQQSSIPWRRSNVRHTSNELYVDLVETLDVTFAPSGRCLSAFANGTVAFTCKVSGVPDLLLNLASGSVGGGGDRGDRLRRTMLRPIFHPCVRLARWKQHGELSFVPPDGRFILAGYEADLLDGTDDVLDAGPEKINMPVSLVTSTGVGAAGNEVEVKLSVNPRFNSGSGSGSGSGRVSPNPSSTSMQGMGNTIPRAGPRSAAMSLASLSSSSGDSKNPTIEDLRVTIPLPPNARKIPEIRASRGEAHFSPADQNITWTISSKILSQIPGASLRFTVVGHDEDAMGGEANGLAVSNGLKTKTYDYDEGDAGGYQSQDVTVGELESNDEEKATAAASEARRQASTDALMPRSINVSFSVKGWLASGLKVDSLTIDTKRSKGLGEGVRPYKGVKYLSVSTGGIEVRC